MNYIYKQAYFCALLLFMQSALPMQSQTSSPVPIPLLSASIPNDNTPVMRSAFLENSLAGTPMIRSSPEMSQAGSPMIHSSSIGNSPLSSAASSVSSSASVSPNNSPPREAPLDQFQNQPGIRNIVGICIRCNKNNMIVFKPFMCDHKFCVECDRTHNRRGCSVCIRSEEALRDCAICWEELTPESKRSLVCNHYFCATCIQQWRASGKNTCPICRVALYLKREVACEICYPLTRPAAQRVAFREEAEVTMHQCKDSYDTVFALHYYCDECIQYKHVKQVNEQRRLRKVGDIHYYPCPEHPECYHPLKPSALEHLPGHPPPPGIDPKTAQAVQQAYMDHIWEKVDENTAIGLPAFTGTDLESNTCAIL